MQLCWCPWNPFFSLMYGCTSRHKVFVRVQENDSGVSLGPDSVAPSRLNSSITRLYKSTSQPSAATGALGGHSSSAIEHNTILVNTAAMQPTATGACVQPATQTIGSSSHTGAPQAAPTPQAQPKESGDDANASQLDDERPSGARTNKKKGKTQEGKAKSLKRVRDSAGDAGPAAKRASIVAPRRIFYSDLGGIDDVLTDIRHLIEYPLMHPEVCPPGIPFPQPTDPRYTQGTLLWFILGDATLAQGMFCCSATTGYVHA